MTIKNWYYKRSRIAEKKFRQIIRFFSMDFSVEVTAKLTGVFIRSINPAFVKLCVRLEEECEKHAQLGGHIEVDESYFGPKRIRGKRGRGAGSKTIVFGLFKETVGFTPKSFLMPENGRCSASNGAKSAWTVLSIPMDGVDTMAWSIWDTRSIIVWPWKQ